MAVSGNPVRLAQADLETIIERALEEARSRGASQAEAAVSQDTGLSVGVRLGEVETLEHQRDRSMGITVYFGQRKGSASTADFSLDAVRATVAKACSIARFTAEDAASGLADAALMSRAAQDLDLAHPWNVSAERAIEIAKSCEAAALSFDSRINNSEGRIARHSPRLACLRQYAWLRRRLPDHLAHIELRGARGQRRGYAARLLVQQRPRLARIGAGRGHRARKCAPHHCAPGAAPLDHAPRAGAVRAGDRARLDRPLRGRDSRQQPVPAILVPVEISGSASVSRRVLHRRTAAHSEGDGQRAIR